MKLFAYTWISRIGPVCIVTQPTELGGKPKWLLLDFGSLEPGPTWLLIVLGRQERAWGPVKIDHYSSPLLGRKVTNNAARKF